MGKINAFCTLVHALLFSNFISGSYGKINTMKKILYIIIILVFFAFLLKGCLKQDKGYDEPPKFSDARAFDIDLNAAKKTYETTFLLTVKTNRDILDFVENLKKENIIKPVRNSKEVYFAQNGEFIYKIYLPNLQKSACDFITSRIEDFIKESNYKDCGIVLERALFRKTTELLA